MSLLAMTLLRGSIMSFPRRRESRKINIKATSFFNKKLDLFRFMLDPRLRGDDMVHIFRSTQQRLLAMTLFYISSKLIEPESNISKFPFIIQSLGGKNQDKLYSYNVMLYQIFDLVQLVFGIS
ncbi:MAG TPA: hypothetical protein LFV90_07700 [Rickettsia endosymbiont of Columbicola hoogstraali]|nr:hypothetical protein [Rickettsia endosymbiont of Columbicola hoogstraali]